VDEFLDNQCAYTSDEAYPIAINLGFGPDLVRMVRFVLPGDLNSLLHQHIVYPWSRLSPDPASTRKTMCHPVFPGILDVTDDLEDVLDDHLELVIDSPEHFKSFPLYNSPLSILKHIYPLFMNAKEVCCRENASRLDVQMLT
jgi:hypothetical protein